jgi:hypothetical protein
MHNMVFNKRLGSKHEGVEYQGCCFLMIKCIENKQKIKNSNITQDHGNQRNTKTMVIKKNNN